MACVQLHGDRGVTSRLQNPVMRGVAAASRENVFNHSKSIHFTCACRETHRNGTVMRKEKQMKRVRMAALVAACAFGSAWATANPVTLNNGPGNGTVSITLDGYGSFGGAVGGEAGEAVYDPV